MTLSMDTRKTSVKENSNQRLPEINSKVDSNFTSPKEEYFEAKNRLMPSIKRTNKGIKS